MNRKEIIHVFEMAKDRKLDIAIEITVPEQKTTDLIITRHENLDNKLEFYKKAYDENGVHCMNKEVRIVDANCINFFTEFKKEI
jgi:hypothetical protein